jgi:hypothetical protein
VIRLDDYAGRDIRLTDERLEHIERRPEMKSQVARVELFAVRNDDYPGGWFYRFQYYHPEDGKILRYDNAHDDDELGWHHRHVRSGEDSEIAFHGLVVHVTRFMHEIAELTDTEETTHD